METVTLAGGAAVIGIIIAIVACLCITGGCIWYHKCHKKKEEAFNSDDLYEAFVNNDQAWVTKDWYLKDNLIYQ